MPHTVYMLGHTPQFQLSQGILTSTRHTAAHTFNNRTKLLKFAFLYDEMYLYTIFTVDANLALHIYRIFAIVNLMDSSYLLCNNWCN